MANVEVTPKYPTPKSDIIDGFVEISKDGRLKLIWCVDYWDRQAKDEVDLGDWFSSKKGHFVKIQVIF